MTENIKITTRSYSLDYDTFNVDKFGSWWENFKDFYNDYSDGIYVEIEDGKWRIFFDKINSDRKDNVGEGRQIYFALEGSGKIGNDDFHSFLKLIFFVMTKDRKKITLSKLFNREFPAEFINPLDNKRHTEETDKAVKQKLDKIFEELPKYDDTVKSSQQLSSGAVFVKKFNEASCKEFLSQLLSVGTKAGKTILVYTDSYADEDTVNKMVAQTMPERGFILTSQEEQEFDGKVSIPVKKVPEPVVGDKKKANSTSSKKLSKKFLVSCALNLILVGVIFGMSLSRNSERMGISATLLEKVSVDSLTICLMQSDSTINVMKKTIDSLSVPQFTDTITNNVIHLDIAEFFKTGICKTTSAKIADTVSVYSHVDFEKHKCEVRVYKNGVLKGSSEMNLK